MIAFSRDCHTGFNVGDFIYYRINGSNHSSIIVIVVLNSEISDNIIDNDTFYNATLDLKIVDFCNCCKLNFIHNKGIFNGLLNKNDKKLYY
jgi:hypothetical protein